jgi:hypothetical protein
MKTKRLAGAALLAGLALAGAMMTSACSNTSLDAKAIEDKYGVSGATTENILTADGAMMPSTVVPVTLPDGQKAQLVIPHKSDGNAVYLRDQEGMHPILLQDRAVSRDQFVRSNPTVVERRVVPQQSKKRSWQKEALIIGGGDHRSVLQLLQRPHQCQLPSSRQRVTNNISTEHVHCRAR